MGKPETHQRLAQSLLRIPEVFISWVCPSLYSHITYALRCYKTGTKSASNIISEIQIAYLGRTWHCARILLCIASVSNDS